jgi:hypothetical protein
VLVDLADTRAWFNDYLLAFAACGRGASDDLGALIDYYGVPLLLTTDADAVTLMMRRTSSTPSVARSQACAPRATTGPRRSTPRRP